MALRKADKEALNRAFAAGSVPRRAPKTAATIVNVPGARYRTLAAADDDLTAAGKYWYEQLSSGGGGRRMFSMEGGPQ